ncbi:MAG: hypothetical protein U0V48_16365 [Anaerolineales bacterium]
MNRELENLTNDLKIGSTSTAPDALNRPAKLQSAAPRNYKTIADPHSGNCAGARPK